MTNFIPFILGALPLIFLPVTQDYYDTNKWVVLVGITGISLIVWTLSSTRRISLSPTTISVALVAMTSLLSLVFASTNVVEALLSPFGPITFGCLFLLSLFSPLWQTKRLIWSICAGISLLGIFTIYQAAGMGKLMFPQVPFLSDPIWTPTGSLLATLCLLIIGLSLVIKQIQSSLTKSIMTTVIISGIAVGLWLFIPRMQSSLLPNPFGWSMLEIFKTPKSAIFGMGTENFQAAFSSGRPIAYNLTPFWDIRFTTSASMLLHIATIYGLSGALAFVIFLLQCSRKLPLGSIALVFLPPNLSVLIITIAILIALQQDHTNLSLHKPWIKTMLFIIVSLSTLLGFYLISRVYLAELAYYQSIRTIQTGRGTDAYNLLIRAIKLNPAVSKYHVSYSKISLALATALTKETDEKDQKLATELITQAIREAKIAVNLNSKSITAWENLARTYKELIGVAKDADVWATTTYKEVMQKDPVNPVLAFELGGILMKRQNYTEAITQLRKAVTLKPDYTNAWYNLGYAFKLNGDIPSAQKAFEQVQNLVDKNSPEYRTVTEELTKLGSL